MIEIRYRLTTLPGVPHPFAPWFRRTLDGCVHGTSIRFDGDRGSGRYLATTPAGSLRDLKEDMLAHPPPAATVWRLAEERGDVIAFDAEWTEPIYPGIPSPMKVASDILGPEALISFTMTHDVLIHRHLVPPVTPPMELWGALQSVMAKFIALTGTNLVFELERLGPWIPEDRVGDADARVILLAAFMLGYYDTPPRATVQDVALATGVPGKVALGHLKDVEAALLKGGRTS